MKKKLPLILFVTICYDLSIALMVAPTPVIYQRFMYAFNIVIKNDAQNSDNKSLLYVITDI